MSQDNLVIAGKTYQSRLLVGTGKYKDLEETRNNPLHGCVYPR